MRRGALILLLFGLAACPGGDGALGDRCGGNGDCASALQCVDSVCVARCQRAPDCGDGFACDQNGFCQAGNGQPGDECTSEVQCAPGLACELDGTAGANGALLASCVAENATRPAGAVCAHDAECRDGTCALGHCVDLCSDTRDCASATSCVMIPRIEIGGAMFAGCLQAHGTLSWALPISGPAQDVLLPIPDSAHSVAVTFSVDDLNEKVGVTTVLPPAPATDLLYDLDLDYFTTPVRHQPDFGQSVLAMPSSPEAPLAPGAYRLHVSSLRTPFAKFSPGSATPTATAVIKLDASVLLDLHFYFLNFEDHPCGAAFGGTLDAATAEASSFFQNDFLGALRGVFAHGGVALGTMTYEDLGSHPDLDGLEVSNAAALLALGAHTVGINVFFVRTLSPSGLQAFGPNPGPAGLAGTRQSGIVIGLDTLCYRSWGQVARLAAHEAARYMGLYDNVELDPTKGDPIADSDSATTNLMFYSELGGGDLSPGQRNILARSPVLR